MKRMLFLLTLISALVLLYMGDVNAQQQQQQSQYPMLDKIAQKVIQKYQTSTCEQLAAQKQEAPSPEEAQMKQKVITMLKGDPQMRQAFLNQVAAPIANKLFECGMIP
jgi:mannitol-1-phosphate/altronate dehydrogenase